LMIAQKSETISRKNITNYNCAKKKKQNFSTKNTAK
jgi:hypothetical protein